MMQTCKTTSSTTRGSSGNSANGSDHAPSKEVRLGETGKEKLQKYYIKHWSGLQDDIEGTSIDKKFSFSGNVFIRGGFCLVWWPKWTCRGPLSSTKTTSSKSKSTTASTNATRTCLCTCPPASGMESLVMLSQWVPALEWNCALQCVQGHQGHWHQKSISEFLRLDIFPSNKTKLFSQEEEEEEGRRRDRGIGKRRRRRK